MEKVIENLSHLQQLKEKTLSDNILPLVKKKCLSSSQDRACNSTPPLKWCDTSEQNHWVCLQLSESNLLFLVQGDGFRAKNQQNLRFANWGGLACRWEKPFQAGSRSVIFNNQQAIQIQLGTKIIHSFTLIPMTSCLKSAGILSNEKQKANYSLHELLIFQKVGYITISLPIRPPEDAPIPCCPSKPSPLMGNFWLDAPKGISNRNTMLTSQIQMLGLKLTWNKQRCS